MATITLKGSPVLTHGDLPPLGSVAPAFTLTGKDLAEVSLSEFHGKKVILNIVPSLDTGICAASARKFNEAAGGLPDTVILNVSADLPFAAKRFCEAEGVDAVQTLSTFRNPGFGTVYGTTMTSGPMKGLQARAIVILDRQHQVVYGELVPEIAQHPNYDAALEALKKA